MAIETKPWDSAAYIHDEPELAGYLELIAEDDEQPTIYANAIAVAARARGGFEALARESGLPQAELSGAATDADEERALPTLRKLAGIYRDRVAKKRMVA